MSHLSFPSPTQSSCTIPAPLSPVVDTLSLESIAVDILGDANYVQDPYAPEKFLISQCPHGGFQQYWSAMLLSKAQVGVQLAEGHFDYHLTPGQSVSFGVNKDQDLGSLECKGSRLLTGDVLERSYVLTDFISGETREFTHFFIEWPDYGVPANNTFASMMLAYKEKVASLNTGHPAVKPVVHVHCIGGHGRSGTFVLSRCLDCIPKEMKPSVDPKTVLDALLKQREKLTETDEQRSFAYNSVDGFEIYGQLNAMLAGRVRWIQAPSKGGNGCVVLPVWKEVLIWLASCIHLKTWALRHLTSFPEALSGMINLRERVCKLAKNHPDLIHHYWTCWKIFQESFKVQPAEMTPYINVGMLSSRSHLEAPSKRVLLATKSTSDIEALLQHYPKPFELANAYINQGMLAQSLWIIQQNQLALSLFQELDPLTRSWFELMSSLQKGEKLPIEALQLDRYKVEGQERIGLGLGVEYANRLDEILNQEPKATAELLPFIISSFEVHSFLSKQAPDLLSEYKQYAASNKEFMANIRLYEKAIGDQRTTYEEKLPKLKRAAIHGKQWFQNELKQILAAYPYMSPQLAEWLLNPVSANVKVVACRHPLATTAANAEVSRLSYEKVSTAITMMITQAYAHEEYIEKFYKSSLPSMPIWIEVVADPELLPELDG